MIRIFVISYYIDRTIEAGLSEITIVAREVGKKLNLSDRMPNICQVLRGTKLRRQIEELYNVKVTVKEKRRETVKKDSSTNEFIFELN